ncbi:CoA-transferase [Neobacillus niacini]|uniref:CoA-transferase n=1 Tax=Neobacillus niacini TaxID=86668 RepID=UPI003983C1F6
MRNSKKHLIAKRIAEELMDGDVVHLSTGLPQLVADYVVDKKVKIILQSLMSCGGHIDFAVLEALEVDEKGNLAIDIASSIGSGLDLITRANKVLIAMTHSSKDGTPKILRECRLPLTAVGQVELIVTNLGVIEVTPNGLLLKEMASGVGLEDILSQTEADLFISDELKTAAFI